MTASNPSQIALVDLGKVGRSLLQWCRSWAQLSVFWSIRCVVAGARWIVASWRNV
jgi:hypothetical protein